MKKTPFSLVVLLCASMLLTTIACQRSLNDLPQQSPENAQGNSLENLPENPPDITDIDRAGAVTANASIAPIHVEAENYSAMNGVMAEACREGGKNVGYISVGDWMEYNVNVPVSGSYTISLRTAGPASKAKVQNANGSDLATINLPLTPSGQVYATGSGQVTLNAGQQKLRIYAVTAAWNFNWFELVSNGSSTSSGQQASSGQQSAAGVIPGTNLLVQSDFEDDKSFAKWAKEICRSSALKISKDVGARKGNHSARFELTKQDVLDFDGYTRAEIRQNSETAAERWYGFSNFLPNDFVADPVAEKIAQWHDVPDFVRGETWRSPPISFGIENDRLTVTVLYASKEVNTIDNIDGQKKFDLGPVERGKWNDWVFHIKYSYKSDGVLEIWKNRTRMLSYYGPNSYNDLALPYFKIGIYKWGWDGWAIFSPPSKRVIYYDEVRVGNENANVPQVSPQ